MELITQRRNCSQAYVCLPLEWTVWSWICLSPRYAVKAWNLAGTSCRCSERTFFVQLCEWVVALKLSELVKSTWYHACNAHSVISSRCIGTFAPTLVCSYVWNQFRFLILCWLYFSVEIANSARALYQKCACVALALRFQNAIKHSRDNLILWLIFLQNKNQHISGWPGR